MAGNELLTKYGSNRKIRDEVIRFINDADYCTKKLETYPQKIRKIINFAYQTCNGILLNPHEMARIFEVDTYGCHSNDYINLFSGCYGIPVYVTTPSDRFSYVCRDVIEKGLIVYLNDTTSEGVPADTNMELLLREGEAKYKRVVQYERNLKNRNQAIEFHGTTCKACHFNFIETYGEHGAGYIEVHHVIPLHQFQESKPIDPRSDLTVLCSNCHRMVHRYKLHYLSVEELKRIIETQRVKLATK